MPNEITTIPFTYLIGWSEHNLYYYGVKHAEGCKPEDLWTKYFTSSKIVADKRIELGEPDIIEVRHIFTNKQDALKWEETVIRRMGAVLSESWLNLQNAGKHFRNHGIPRDIRCRERIRQARITRMVNDPEFLKRCQDQARAASSSQEARDKIGTKAKKRYEDPEYAQNNIDKHNTPEYLEAASERTARLYRESEEYRNNHKASITTPEYRSRQAKDSADRMKDPEYKARCIAAQKAALASPEKRKRMSEAAKKSHADRKARLDANSKINQQARINNNKF